jgi:hypothetical protein
MGEKTKYSPGRFWYLIEKIIIPAFIPITLSILAIIASQKGTEIAESQLELARVQEERLTNQAENNLQLKYMELFYNDITNNDLDRQLKAVSLLEIMNKDLKAKVTNWILSNKDLSQVVKEKAEQSAEEKTVEGYLWIANYNLNNKKWMFNIKNIDHTKLKRIEDIETNEYYLLDWPHGLINLRQRHPEHETYIKKKIKNIPVARVLSGNVRLKIIEVLKPYKTQNYNQYWAKVEIEE